MRRLDALNRLGRVFSEVRKSREAFVWIETDSDNW
jgi:hypothetical protein